MALTKIFILTFQCALNYGAILQAYALQNILNRYGYDAEIYNYRPISIVTPYIPQFQKSTISGFLHSNSKIKYFLKIPISMFQFYCLGNMIKINSYKEFYKKYLKLQCIANVPNSIIVLGSDQIWNPRLTNRDKTYFFSNYPKGNAKVIS